MVYKIIDTIKESIFKMDTYYKDDNFTVTFYIVAFTILIVGLMSYTFIYHYFTNFTRTITVRNTYTRSDTYTRGGTIFPQKRYFVVDINNTVYESSNLWFKSYFNKIDNWTSLEKGNTYKVYGYGVRDEFFNMYPIIYSIEKI